MKKLYAIVFGGFVLIGTALGIGPVSTITASALNSPTVASAQALPGQCGGGGFLGSGGSFCDYDAWPDGSFMHYERVCVLGFCGNNTFRACGVPGGRVPTDSDPATPC